MAADPVPLRCIAVWGKNRAEADERLREWAQQRGITGCANIVYDSVEDGVRAEVYVYDG